MPELPDLEVVREFLGARIVGLPIVAAEVRRPIVVRNLLGGGAGGDAAGHLAGRRFTAVGRRGKYLLLSLDDGTTLVVQPMLAGRIRYGPPLPRHRARDALVLRLADGRELRYHDAKDMGKVYLVADLAQVPAFADQGPEATDPALTLEAFRQLLRGQRGEVKDVLVDQRFVAGIGNAYADEICWRAGLYPFRQQASLDDEEVASLYAAMRAVLGEAIAAIRARLGAADGTEAAVDGGDILGEVRDFLAVHGRAGQPCPRCGNAIREVRRERRATHFCRTCQPGLLVGR